MTSSRPDSVDWYRWHDDYDELDSERTVALDAVQDAVWAYLDRAHAQQIFVTSIAAGQSRELLPVLIDHPRGKDVRAVLVDSDSRNVDFAEGAVLGAQLDGIGVIAADAGVIDSYVQYPRADLVLACGVFDHIDTVDTVETVRGLPQICAAGATLIWTTAGVPDERLESILCSNGFAIDHVDGAGRFRIGVAEMTGPTATPIPGFRLFTFH